MNPSALAAFSLLFALIAPASEVSAQELALANNVHVTTSGSVSAYELYNSSYSQIVSGEAVVLLYRLDPEAVSPNEVAAILLVGEFGTGIEPIVLRVATPDQFVEVAAGEMDGTFDVTIGQARYLLRIERSGVVTLNNTRVGQIH